MLYLKIKIYIKKNGKRDNIKTMLTIEIQFFHKIVIFYFKTNSSIKLT